MKGYSTFPKALSLKPHHNFWSCVIPRTSSIWPRDGTLTPDHSGPGSKSSIPQISGTKALPLDVFVTLSGHSLVGGGVLLCSRNAFGVFYSPSWLGFKQKERWDKFRNPIKTLAIYINTKNVTTINNMSQNKWITCCSN